MSGTGVASGTVSRWPSDGTTEPIILVADALTIEVARNALRASAQGIVTREGGYSCHGANILRLGAQPVPWLSGVNIENLPSGVGAIMSPGGLVLSLNGDPSAARIGLGRPASRLSQSSHELFSWNCDEAPNASEVCYWGHRSYDPLTASVMIPGLELCATRLARRNVDARRDESGRLWFKNARAIDSYREQLVSVGAADSELGLQLEVYESICLQLRQTPTPSMRVIADLLRQYFSVHLIVHNTYEAVLAKFRVLLAAQYSQESSNGLMTAVLVSPITVWQMKDKTLRTGKSIYTTHPPQQAPAMMPTQLLARQWQLVRRHIYPGTPRAIIDYAEHATRVAMLKELKFLLNKKLYSALSLAIAAWRVNNPVSDADLKKLSIEMMM